MTSAPLREGPTGPAPAPPPRRSVLTLLREPRWLRGLAFAIAVALVCVVLGQWQWHRRQERLARNAPLIGNYDATPVPVDSVLPAGPALRAADAWTPVRATGTYDRAATVLVRNRPRDEQTGYEVLVPLTLADGSSLLVDRGWVPAGSDSARPDEVPAPPAGEVSVVARLRPWEPARDTTAPAGQVSTIARGSVAAAACAEGDDDLRGGYAVLASETPAPADAPLPALRPDVDEGPHLAYTIQWYGFAVTALVVWVVAGRRELETRRTGALPGDPAAGTPPDPTAPDTSAPASSDAVSADPDPRDTPGRETAERPA
ncbi:SURF1 family cytochrome oxidase biogenesis protein, partial [Kineococcus rubinsiae]|uniref:SURF1 family cytochrome oxidase biogenesis protein n=1 Tax=Kineococcus rubinsiae TaxID=2609562 RepID=UPI0014318167